jgi:hypothetical protein
MPYKRNTNYTRKYVQRFRPRRRLTNVRPRVQTLIKRSAQKPVKTATAGITQAQLTKDTEVNGITRHVNLSIGRQLQYKRAARQKLSTAPTIEFQTVRNVYIFRMVPPTPPVINASYILPIHVGMLINANQIADFRFAAWQKCRITSFKMSIDINSTNLTMEANSVQTLPSSLLGCSLYAYLDRSGGLLRDGVLLPQNEPQWGEFPGAKLVTASNDKTNATSTWFTTKIPDTWPFNAVQNLGIFGSGYATLRYSDYVIQQYGQVISLAPQALKGPPRCARLCRALHRNWVSVPVV